MQPPPPPFPPVPPARRSNLPLVLGLVAGGFLLVLLTVSVTVLVTSNGSSRHVVKGTVQLRRVLAMTPSACPAGQSGWVTSVKGDACYQLGDGMTITEVKDVRLVSPDSSRGMPSYSVEIALRPQDGGRLTTLTTEVAREQKPRNQLAVVADGKVVSAPMVMEPLTGGTFSLAGDFTRKEAQHYVDIFRG